LTPVICGIDPVVVTVGIIELSDEIGCEDCAEAMDENISSNAVRSNI